MLTDAQRTKGRAKNRAMTLLLAKKELGNPGRYILPDGSRVSEPTLLALASTMITPEKTILLNLIERVEEADSADRNLDADIAFAIGAFDHKLKFGFEDCHIERGEQTTPDFVDVHVVNKGRLIYSESYDYYTSSIDSAKKLKPKDGCYHMFAFEKMTTVIVFPDSELDDDLCFRSTCATEALALTAACLRAKLASLGNLP